MSCIDRYPGESSDIEKKIQESGLVYTRPTKDNYYLDIAVAVSKRSTCIKRHYGCVIVSNDEICATGYNGNPRGVFNCCDTCTCTRLDKPHNTGDYSDCSSVHAEQNALISVSRRDMIGGTLYLACEERKNGKYIECAEDISPCPICMRMIKNSGIAKIVTRGKTLCL